MRKQPAKWVEKFRVQYPTYTSPTGAAYGLFEIPYDGIVLKVMASNGSDEIDWDHVSVSLPDRCPTWEEMCYVKRAFFSGEEPVFQYHPPETRYVNQHPYCLHLWRPHDTEFPMPPLKCV